MNKPLVSVIIPTYNRAHTIKRSINSVLSQTYDKWGLIIVDDGSTDTTRTIIESYADERIHYFKQANAGPSAARNHGISKSTGKWVMYLDSDDYLYPECIATMVEWLGRNPLAVFAFPRSKRMLELYENGKLVKSIDDSEDTPLSFAVQDIFNRNAGFSPNGLTHLRSIFDEGIKWDEGLATMEDWEFMLSIGERYPGGFLYVPVVLQQYSQRFGSDNLVSRATYKTWADAFEYIYQKHKNDKTLVGQTWYPGKVKKWLKRQREFETGKRPPYHLHYFQ